MSVKNYQDLKIWQKAMALAVEIYKLTKILPESEVDFSNQIRESAVYVPSRIAEAHEIFEISDEECFECLSSAHSNLKEVETQLQLGLMTGWFNDRDAKTALSFCREISEDLISMVEELADDD